MPVHEKCFLFYLYAVEEFNAFIKNIFMKEMLTVNKSENAVI